MIVLHKTLRKKFSARGVCECCDRRGPTDCAHIFSVGAGRVDIAKNMVSLLRSCHTLSHNANSENGVQPNHERLMEIAAKRENTTPEDIEATVYRLRACDLCKVWNVDNCDPECTCPEDRKVWVGPEWYCVDCSSVVPPPEPRKLMHEWIG